MLEWCRDLPARRAFRGLPAPPEQGALRVRRECKELRVRRVIRV